MLLLKLWFCHFKVILASPWYLTTGEHFLHEYELDDETLQKAQVEQHKIFQNFHTNPAPSAPRLIQSKLQNSFLVVLDFTYL